MGWFPCSLPHQSTPHLACERVHVRTHTFQCGPALQKPKTTRSKSCWCSRCQVVPPDSYLTPSRDLTGPWQGTDLVRKAEGWINRAPALLVNLPKEGQCSDATQRPSAPREMPTQLLLKRKLELWTCFANWGCLWPNVIKFEVANWKHFPCFVSLDFPLFLF